MERAAFDRLLTANVGLIEEGARRYARKYNILHEWQDIAQSVFLNLLRFADLYDPDKGELLPWAYVTIINTIKQRLNQLRTLRQKEEALNIVVAEVTPCRDPTPEGITHMNLLWEILTEEARLYLDGYSYSDIAARCGLRSKSTVKERIDKNAERLSRVLGMELKQGRRGLSMSRPRNKRASSELIAR